MVWVQMHSTHPIIVKAVGRAMFHVLLIAAAPNVKVVNTRRNVLTPRMNICDRHFKGFQCFENRQVSLAPIIIARAAGLNIKIDLTTTALTYVQIVKVHQNALTRCLKSTAINVT